MDIPVQSFKVIVMTNCMTFQKKILAVPIMLIVLSNSGCVAELNSQELNYEASSNNIIIISSMEDLQKVMDSDTSSGFSQNLVYYLVLH